MDSESQNIFFSNEILTPPPLQPKEDLSITKTPEQLYEIISNLIHDLLLNGNTNDIGFASEALKAYNKTSHTENIYPLVIQQLTDFYQDIINNRLENPLTLNSFINIFNYIIESIENLSKLFEDISKFNLGGFTVNNIAYKFIKDELLQNETLTNAIYSIIAENYEDFRLNKSVNPNFVDFVKIILHFKMENEITNALLPSVSKEMTDTIPTSSASVFLTNVTDKIRNEVELFNVFPLEISKVLLLPVRICLYSKALHLCLERFTEEILSEKNFQALSILSSLVSELHDRKLNDQFIQILSESAIRTTSAAINRNSVACIPELVEIHKLYSSLVSSYFIPQADYCLKYFKGCVVTSCNRIAYLASRYIHQQIQQNDSSFISKIREINLFLKELDSNSYLFTCFRQFLGLRMINYYPEFPMTESQLLQEMRTVFSNDQIEMLNHMHTDLKECINTCSTFSNNDLNLTSKIVIMSVEIWPPYPHIKLVVDDEILKIRSDFENFYTTKFAGRKLTWMDTLETCVFIYQGCSIVASTLQYVALKCLLNGKDLIDYGIPQEHRTEIISSLNRAGLIVRRGGKITFPKLKASRKTMRINTLTISFPTRCPEKSDEEIFELQRKHIENAVMRTLKKENELTYPQLYRETQDLLKFPLYEKSFKSCLSKLLALDLIVKGNDKIYRYFPV
ncbi:hypothetical protein TRFO_12366 [Tritrichomonas foetus]|uniref:Cullin family profile domain-containing protein n=1 Tax=Tritrichomonas foetus TaxID=1144522 RepID=A0A1J4L1W9_9EUKA|nr:hypothetical protein TRFO_12366 [Tritrichomonas foetus]|eukprot:OHT17410.1 hypothetical protein TRFO_12366 [Tritrichomonas foetus]